MQEIKSRISDEFSGYNDGAVFRLDNGQAWQQRTYKYAYRYAYRPTVRIYEESGRVLMAVECMNEPIEVVPVRIIAEGVITSDFRGFSQVGTQFELQQGGAWEQAEYKYAYHYAYRPEAVVIEGVNGTELHVSGMDSPVRVRRIS